MHVLILKYDFNDKILLFFIKEIKSLAEPSTKEPSIQNLKPCVCDCNKVIEEVSNDTNKDAPEEEIVCEAMESVGISRYGFKFNINSNNFWTQES